MHLPGSSLGHKKTIQNYASCSPSKDYKKVAWLEGHVSFLSWKEAFGENSAICNAYPFLDNFQNALVGHLKCRFQEEFFLEGFRP
jgi:hypothetical protein